MANNQQPQKPGLPNPYAQAGLPNPYAHATVASAAPVKYSADQAKTEQKKAPASHFHNPHNIKRPQAKKAGPAVKKPLMPVVSSTSSDAAPTAAPSTQQHGIDWYRSTADDDAAIMEERRQRQWEEKQKKKEQKKFQKQFGYWNPQAPHKPERYSNLKAYRASGGYRRKIEDFNAFLRGAAGQAPKSRDDSEEPNGSRPTSSSSTKTSTFAAKSRFAPPSFYDAPTANVPDDDSEDEAYARRPHFSQQQQSAVPPPPPSVEIEHSAPPPPPPTMANPFPPPPPQPMFTPASGAPPPPMPASLAGAPGTTTTPAAPYHNATTSAPPVRYAGATISAPPVRYERPDERPDEPMVDAEPEPTYEERPAKRPKISKAEAMMAKMGYVKGQGLGKNNDGVVTHLEVKKRKVPQGSSGFDDDGAKIKSQLVWDVHGGHRNPQDEEPSRFGAESSVVAMWGCVDGVNWDEDRERNDGGVRQDMGEVFSSKFGPVEHIQINESSADGVVYVLFKSVMSALNAVNRFDEGYEYRGRKIRAQYYDERKFHAGIYEH